MTIELFRSDDVLVRASRPSGAEPCIVTFDNHGSPADLDQPGFGELFLAERGIAAVIARGRGNRWYQYPEMQTALAAITRHVAPSRRVLTYGSSMGGYAAIRFAGAIGADGCLALSPQYSLVPHKVPFERRWAQDAGSIAWREDLDGPLAASCVPILVYDARGPDRRHAELIAAEMAIVAIPIPYGGHPITTFLSSAGLLEPLVLAALDGSIDAAHFRREALTRRRGDPVHLIELSRRLPPRRHPLALALARRAVAERPHSELALHALASRLSAAGEHEEALVLHRRAAERAPGIVVYRRALSEALEAAGDLPAALAIAQDIARDDPDRAFTQSWLGHLLWASGDQLGALACARRAVALSPTEPHYASTLALYRYRRSLPVRLRRWLARTARQSRGAG